MQKFKAKEKQSNQPIVLGDIPAQYDYACRSWTMWPEWSQVLSVYQAMNKMILQSFLCGLGEATKCEGNNAPKASRCLVVIPLKPFKKGLIKETKENGILLVKIVDDMAFSCNAQMRFVSNDADMGKDEKDEAKGALCYLFEEKVKANRFKAAASKLLRKNGVALKMEMSGVPLKDENGNWIDFVVEETPKA
jgi:hypothetical protein